MGKIWTQHLGLYLALDPRRGSRSTGRLPGVLAEQSRGSESDCSKLGARVWADRQIKKIEKLGSGMT
jgi:hypothetical protein